MSLPNNSSKMGNELINIDYGSIQNFDGGVSKYIIFCTTSNAGKWMWKDSRSIDKNIVQKGIMKIKFIRHLEVS